MGNPAPTSILYAAASIEAEFMEPLRAVVTGFIPLGTTRRETAETLGVSPHSLRCYCQNENIHFPTLQERRRRGGHFISEAEAARRRSISKTRRLRAMKKYTHNGESLCLSEWAERSGIHKNTLQSRLKNGLSISAALAQPPQS